jgi:hypothetical protein
MPRIGPPLVGWVIVSSNILIGDPPTLVAKK